MEPGGAVAVGDGVGREAGEGPQGAHAEALQGPPGGQVEGERFQGQGVEEGGFPSGRHDHDAPPAVRAGQGRGHPGGELAGGDPDRGPAPAGPRRAARARRRAEAFLRPVEGAQPGDVQKGRRPPRPQVGGGGRLDCGAEGVQGIQDGIEGRGDGPQRGLVPGR